MKKNPISCVSTNQTVKLTNRSDEQQQQQSIHSSNGEHILKTFSNKLPFYYNNDKNVRTYIELFCTVPTSSPKKTILDHLY
ncbi:hypothetical protein HUG17_1605 [Dermatophagoides farinae]|uniref:Uncharacterized protein n=1 Tax=Dermatophagoides farinae TaxID=6954 RepID=A0A9D4P8J2_DERFA|nr:hypothetical protein HUG17_1605 [Dermatophagoides farinae]